MQMCGWLLGRELCRYMHPALMNTLSYSIGTLQISMSVRKALTVVVIMQPVTILTVATIAPVYLDSLEMDRCAVVCCVIRYLAVRVMFAAPSDIDECGRDNNCAVNATCNNTFGSFNCRCLSGYDGDGVSCIGK